MGWGCGSRRGSNAVTLEERIDAWPEQMKGALTRLAEAKAAAAQVAIELRSAQGAGEDDGEDEGPKTTEARRRLDAAEQALTDAGDALEQAKALADIEAREEAQQTGKRLTESGVKAKVTANRAVIAATNALRSARRKVEMTEMELDSAHDQDEADGRRAKLAGTGGEQTSRSAMLLQRQVDAAREVQVALAEVRYQRTVGQALQMLVNLRGLEVPVGHRS